MLNPVAIAEARVTRCKMHDQCLSRITQACNVFELLRGLISFPARPSKLKRKIRAVDLSPEVAPPRPGFYSQGGHSHRGDSIIPVDRVGWLSAPKTENVVGDVPAERSTYGSQNGS